MRLAAPHFATSPMLQFLHYDSDPSRLKLPTPAEDNRIPSSVIRHENLISTQSGYSRFSLCGVIHPHFLHISRTFSRPLMAHFDLLINILSPTSLPLTA